VPCFTSTTNEAAGTLLATNALVVGGGSGVCPATGNGDFTYTTHTLTMASTGVLNLSAGASGSFVVPNINCTTATTTGEVALNTASSNGLCFRFDVSHAYSLATSAAAGTNGTNCLTTNQVLTQIVSNGVPTCTSVGVLGITSVTPATSSNPTINTDQNLIQLSLPAGYLNVALRVSKIEEGGVYSSTSASSPALTYKVKLCTVSGCGSGTVLSLFNIVSSALNTTALTNATMNLVGTCVTNTTGTTGNLICHGAPGLTLDTGSTLSTPDTVFADTNTAVTGNIDLTAALFLQFTVAQSVVGASNSYTQQYGLIQ